MEPFTKHAGTVAVLDRTDVDTDQIIPKQFLKRIERTGYGDFLFFDWRSKDDGSLNTDFELNSLQYKDASILVTGRNFGCGSSREHAVWAIHQHGFRAIIAPSFAEIFHKNCFENGLCPILLSQEQVSELISKISISHPKPYHLTVDLSDCTISDDQGLNLPFVIHTDKDTHDFRRNCLLKGLDGIELTLQHQEAISKFEKSRGIA